jgi:hypothetical protein
VSSQCYWRREPPVRNHTHTHAHTRTRRRAHPHSMQAHRHACSSRTTTKHNEGAALHSHAIFIAHTHACTRTHACTHIHAHLCSGDVILQCLQARIVLADGFVKLLSKNTKPLVQRVLRAPTLCVTIARHAVTATPTAPTFSLEFARSRSAASVSSFAISLVNSGTMASCSVLCSSRT